MACACRTAAGSATVVTAAAENIPHEVKPGESCIFCADKHLSAAYVQLYSVRGGLEAAIGDLELARRHTAVDYPAVCAKLAQCEEAVLLRLDAVQLFAAARSAVDAAMEGADPESPVQGGMLPEFSAGTVSNPFIGELHLCAAARLAFEVGYMGVNRDMIKGDLVLAAEHFARFDYGMLTRMRELRHRIQQAKAADLDIYWQYVCRGAGKLIAASLDSFREEYARGLAEYIGAESILGV